MQQEHKKATASLMRTGESREFPEGKRTHRHDNHRIETSNRHRSHSRVFRRAASNALRSSSESVSSKEKARSRDASPISNSYSRRHARKSSISPIRRSRGRAVNWNTQETDMPVLLPQRDASVGSLNTMPGSSLSVGEQEHDQTKHHAKEQIISHLPARRTRIPRPCPQSRSADSDFALSTDTTIPEPRFNRGSAYVRSCTDDSDTPATPMSDHAETELTSEPQHLAALSDVHETPRHENTERSNNEEATKSPCSSRPATITNTFPNDRSHDNPASPEGPSRARVSRASDESSNSKTKKPTYRAPSCQSPDANTQSAPDLHPNSGGRDSVEQLLGQKKPKAAETTKPLFNCDEPETPTDASYGDGMHSPYIVNDSWSGYQSDLEREAEAMAERDLAHAGKLFDNLSSTLGGSATSTFPWSSFSNTSNMSIVSYYSDSDHSNIGTPPLDIEEADDGKDAEDTEADQLIRRIGKLYFHGVLGLYPLGHETC